MEKTIGEVRLMTVHGAKGLESNIVILPDAASITGNNSAPKLVRLPENELGAGLPIWKLSNLANSQKIEAWSNHAKLKQQAERNRLLYVAMTRACDELYIGGIKGEKSLPPGCWYETISKALCEPDQQDIKHYGPEAIYGETDLGIEPTRLKLPDWVSSIPEPEFPIAVQGVTNLIKRNSKGYDAAASKRGVAIHTLLQDLADISLEKRMNFALRKSKQLGLDEAEGLKLAALINQPELSIFFGLESRSEADLRGELPDGRKVTGRLDRIAIFETEIAILDYKSDLIVPHELEADHPYIAQMALYAELLRNAYPDRQIKAALLWTETADITWIAPELLAQGFQHAIVNFSDLAS
jgi:ATP-dependent helicase/nuclease subunit A